VKVQIDARCCQGHGRCYDLAPGLFGDDDEGYGTVLGDGTVPPGQEHGARRCLGSHLARMELRVALRVWLERIPEFTLADPAAVTWAAGQVRGPRALPLRLKLGKCGG
jgi:cytochrome P450